MVLVVPVGFILHLLEISCTVKFVRSYRGEILVFGYKKLEHVLLVTVSHKSRSFNAYSYCVCDF